MVILYMFCCISGQLSTKRFIDVLIFDSHRGFGNMTLCGRLKDRQDGTAKKASRPYFLL